MRETAYEWGVRYGACKESLELRKNYDSQADWYKVCQNGIWLIWQLRKLPNYVLVDKLSALMRAIDVIVDRAVYCGIWSLRYDASDAADEWFLWADRWLTGEDRSLGAVQAVSDVVWDADMQDVWAVTWIAERVAWTTEKVVRTAKMDDVRVIMWSAASVVESTATRAAWAEERAWRAALGDALGVIASTSAWDAWATEVRQQAKDLRREIPEWPGGES